MRRAPTRQRWSSDYYRQSPDRLSEKQVRDYLSYLKNEKHFAAGSLKIAYSGLKFFFNRTVPRQWTVLEHLKVPPEKTLSVVLSVDEVRRIVAAVRTPHNRVCLWTLYSCGLRLSELDRVSLLTAPDADSGRAIACPFCGGRMFATGVLPPDVALFDPG